MTQPHPARRCTSSPPSAARHRRELAARPPPTEALRLPRGMRAADRHSSRLWRSREGRHREQHARSRAVQTAREAQALPPLVEQGLAPLLVSTAWDLGGWWHVVVYKPAHPKGEGALRRPKPAGTQLCSRRQPQPRGVTRNRGASQRPPPGEQITPQIAPRSSEGWRAGKISPRCRRLYDGLGPNQQTRLAAPAQCKVGLNATWSGCCK